MSTETYQRLSSATRLVNDAAALAGAEGLACGRFENALDALQNGWFEQADSHLRAIERQFDDQNVLTPVRNARQLVIALKEDWSQ